jgi:hypothetical protein
MKAARAHLPVFVTPRAPKVFHSLASPAMQDAWPSAAH